MSKSPTLVIMAAGLGSRYKGDKQADAMTPQGDFIMDFSLYDAMLAGFEDAVIIIRKDLEDAIRGHLEEGAMKRMNIKFAFQDVKDTLGIDIHKKITEVAKKYNLDEKAMIAELENRARPWGTSHAVLAARELIDGPFAVLNADDFYGGAAFQHIYDFLTSDNTAGGDSGEASDPKMHFAMVGYELKKTLSETGSVSRGVCVVDDRGYLEEITERTSIMRQADGEIAFSEDGEKTWTPLPEDSAVSMNFWGFPQSMVDALADGFPEALENILATNIEKGEYYLPKAVDRLLKEGKADVKVLRSGDQWYGVTNKEDKNSVQDAIQSLKDKGLYPEYLWL